MKIHFATKMILALVVFCTSCRSEEEIDLTSDQPINPHYFNSVDELFQRNAEPIITREVNAGAGATFTTVHGTIVTIPQDAFVNASGNVVTGQVNIEFKDVFEKSEMMLSGLSTHLTNGEPLKTGGMFFIRAEQNNDFLALNTGKKITVELPINSDTPDNAMQPFVLNNGTELGWDFPFPLFEDGPADTIIVNIDSYIYSLYNLHAPADSGTWCNSDNSSFFSAYPQTVLAMITDLTSLTEIPKMFLVFQDVESMVHVYAGTDNFTYFYAPVGLSCTTVSVYTQNGKIYACFTPITVETNMTVNLNYTETTEAAFMQQLLALNN